MGWVRIVTGWLVAALGYVLYGLVYVVFLALTPLIYWLEEHVGYLLQFNIERLEDMQRGIMEAVEQPAAVTVPPAVDEGMRWFGLLGVLALVALAFAAALRILRKRDDEDEDEVRETVLSQALLRDQAASLWRRWRDRCARTSDGDGPFFSLAGEHAARRRIRAAYQAFLAAMTAQEHPRARRQTPYRYATVAANLCRMRQAPQRFDGQLCRRPLRQRELLRTTPKPPNQPGPGFMPRSRAWRHAAGSDKAGR